MIKLIACDVDGTLLDSKSRLNTKTKEAILNAQEKDVKFLICSGRSNSEVKLLKKQFGLDVEAICLNGADLRNENGKEIVAHIIEDKYIDYLEKYAKANSYIIEYHCCEKTYMTCSRDELYVAFFEYESMQKNWNEKNARDLFNEIWRYDDETFNASIENIKNEKVLKIEFLYLPENNYQDIYNKLSKLDLNIAYSSNFNNIELNDTKASKGNTLLDYCKINHFVNDEVVVIGDSLNDMSMFEMFENSIAVENAVNQIKKKAKYITLSNDDCGVARVIEKIIEFNKTVD